MSDGGSIYLEAFTEGWTPDAVMSVSEWADANRILSSVVSAEAGRWRTERTPYVREIMDCMSAHDPTRKVIWMAGSQIAKTELVNNCVGYAIDQAPGPILFVEPTTDLAKAESKQRVAPMIDSSPCLREKVSDPRARDSGNTILMKEFPGGILVLTGANSPRGLRRMPARYVFLDEVDAYPGDVGGAERGEGDPVSLAEKRAQTFARRKVLLTSTPTIKGLSRIEQEYQASDQRRYFVPCPHCGNMDWIRWENIRFEEGDPSTAKLMCVACESQIEERHKPEMLARGQWRPTVEDPEIRTRGYHLSAFYSPLGWKSWSDCVFEFLEGKEDPLKLKTWVNTVLGETWEERSESVDAGELVDRLETYAADVPTGVGILVASVDVQGDRLEISVKGYGSGEESWLIAYHQIFGDPAEQKVWFDLDEWLKQKFTHESGRQLRIQCTTVDSGGHHTEHVYRFCKARVHRRVFAVKGGTERGKPVLPKRPTDRNQYRAKLFTLCVDTAKEIVYSRLRIGAPRELKPGEPFQPTPGYVHLPDWVDGEYLAQLTAEKSVRRWVKGRGTVRDWIKIRERNEALDLEVYALAALYILGHPLVRSLPERAAALAKPLEEGEDVDVDKPRPRKKRRGGGWVSGWK